MKISTQKRFNIEETQLLWGQSSIIQTNTHLDISQVSWQILAQSRRHQVPLTAMFGQKQDGESMLSGPLFQKTQGEDNGEEKSEADVSEERDAEESGEENLCER